MPPLEYELKTALLYHGLYEEGISSFRATSQGSSEEANDFSIPQVEK
jgi:hypothetical protein